jgi:hypothetical protein
MFSEKPKEQLWTMIAVSPILQRLAFPGIFGLALMGLGVWQDILWLSIAGLILAAPVVWCILLITVVYPVLLLFDKPPKRYWEE